MIKFGSFLLLLLAIKIFYCRQQLKDERRQRREDLKKERQLRKEEHMKKIERKMRRKTKFENMTCNAEKMNCFTQDNNHWKTPPLWTGNFF